MSLLTKIFGSKHERDIKRMRPMVARINEIYETLQELSDDALRAKTDKFKKQIAEATAEVREELVKLNALLRGENEAFSGNGVDRPEDELQLTTEELRNQIAGLEQEERQIIKETLDAILPEAYAVVKETCRRLCGQTWHVVGHPIKWDMVPYDVQLIGGIVLHEGKIAEMATGEGKTLVATMPLYLNALAGKGVHLVTVNDYLARRDCEWMGKIFEFLGLRAAYITNDMNPQQRRDAYNADITYGTNNEFGFDYLRDNMAVRPEDQVQRGHYFAIVDEVDSVLIDEARTPLIISGPVEQSVDQYDAMKPRVDRLVNAQTQLVNRLMSEAEKLLEEGREYDAGVKLLQVQRGAPKNKRFMKLLQEAGTKKLIHRVESDYLRDKRMHELDEELYFAIDEKAHTIDTTEKGREFLSPNEPEMFVLPDLGERMHQLNTDTTLAVEEKEKLKAELIKEYAEKSDRVHSIAQLLRAYSLYEKDVEYVVNDGKVVIVDEFTGRLMPGRRYSDGLHQALEAKEGVRVEGETQTLATITLQNYFRMYHKLAGMTGTAETEAGEFWEIYKLDVVVIPTNEPVRRMDYDDQIYRTRREKYNAVIDEIAEMHEKKRPVLVGTISVEVSETLSRMLKRKGIPHKVLNAKYHQQEAEIVALAGQPGAVTIATNMAGRGTDIKLGKGVVLAPSNHQCALIPSLKNSQPLCPHLDEYKCRENVPCGLHIIGTERHEARRIDRQLRGRSGRQGDPGSSRFYLSLEDDLMRLFGSERIAAVMDRLGAEEGEVITHGMVTRSIERAQKRVEGHNFSIRKHLLEYDDVMNKQRTVIYSQRAQALRGENLRDQVLQMIETYIQEKVGLYCGGHHVEEWDWEGLQNSFQRVFLVSMPEGLRTRLGLQADDLRQALVEEARAAYARKETFVSPKIMRQIERLATLRAIDEKWREHLYEMDQLKEGINLRAYGQKDPLLEYKSEGFRMFEEMLGQIDEQILETIFKTQVVEPPPVRRRVPQQISTVHQSSIGMGFQGQPQQAPPAGKRQPRVVDEREKIGRNEPCWCGSGKKYKKCHGAEA
ncbi:MAG: preprotein translocase subunit SecA [candidate division KSB1 bacterium]|nr:preprotein translocase subunit SecA [candidate division KSB1 bacterium]MDZ7367999.1 preprotein translocase subunit SecA [candidate division KSB1 bacterium]MDZ7405622.1 preprotein translocase subunit SecA [candidate division KSB1 bacterium]